MSEISRVSELHVGDNELGDSIDSLIMAGLTPSEATDAVLNDTSPQPPSPDTPNDMPSGSDAVTSPRPIESDRTTGAA